MGASFSPTAKSNNLVNRISLVKVAAILGALHSRFAPRNSPDVRHFSHSALCLSQRGGSARRLIRRKYLESNPHYGVKIANSFPPRTNQQRVIPWHHRPPFSPSASAFAFASAPTRTSTTRPALTRTAPTHPLPTATSPPPPQPDDTPTYHPLRTPPPPAASTSSTAVSPPSSNPTSRHSSPHPSPPSPPSSSCTNSPLSSRCWR